MHVKQSLTLNPLMNIFFRFSSLTVLSFSFEFQTAHVIMKATHQPAFCCIALCDPKIAYSGRFSLELTDILLAATAAKHNLTAIVCCVGAL